MRSSKASLELTHQDCLSDGRKRGGQAKKKQALSKAELLEAARAKAEERAAAEGTRQGRVRHPTLKPLLVPHQSDMARYLHMQA